jgi:ComF family protein
MILRIKFRGDMYAARYLSLLSAQQIDKIVAQEQMPCKIVPIPLHWRKLLHRGFNQSELMAKYIFPAGLMADNILCRTKNTRSQRGLTKKERDKNVKNVFQAKGAVRKGCFIILDDVYTTGATVNSAAHALRKAGADRVHVITIARTPSGKSLNPASHG